MADTASLKKPALFISAQVFLALLIGNLFAAPAGAATSLLVPLIAYILVFDAPAFAFVALFVRENPFARLGLVKNASRGAFFGICISGAVLAAFLAKNGLHTRALGEAAILEVLGKALAGPLEEIPFRGLYLGILENKLGFWAANAISSILFGLVHVRFADPGSMSAAVFMAVAGFGLGLLYRGSGSLYAPIIAHSCYNVCTVLF